MLLKTAVAAIATTVGVPCCCCAALPQHGQAAPAKAGFSTPPSKAEQKGVEIPLSLDSATGYWPLVHVRINGSRPLPFLLDTGFFTFVTIDPWAAKEAKFPVPASENSTSTSSSSSGPAQRLVAKNESGTIGLVTAEGTLHQVPCPTVEVREVGAYDDTGTGPKIAGIIGAPLLRSYTLRFDFARKRLTLFAHPHPPFPAENGSSGGAVSIPLKGGHPFNPDHRWVAVTLPGSEPGSKPVHLIVDTGSSRVHLPLPLVAKVPDLRIGQGTETHYLVNGVGSKSVPVLLPFLRMGQLTEKDVVAHVDPVTLKMDYTQELLGMDFLRRFRVTLDYKNNVMLLERASDYAERVRPRGYIGVTVLSLNEGGKRFVRVHGNSPAYRAGVLPRDTLLAIDGKSVKKKEMPTRSVQELADGVAGTTAQLLLERAGKEFAVSIKREPFFVEPDASPKLGITVKPEMDGEALGTLSVASVTKGALGDKAGLKVGDEIIAIGGQPVRGMTIQTLGKLMERRTGTEIVLSIRREGSDKTQEIRLRDESIELVDMLRAVVESY